MFTFDRYDRQMKTFGEMTTKLGIDPIDFARDCLGYRLATAIRRCSTCQAGDTCRDWLARAGQADNAPAFCPNRDVFAMVRRAPAKAHHPAPSERRTAAAAANSIAASPARSSW